MILTDVNIKIIETEIKRYSDDTQLIEHLHSFRNLEFIAFILSEKEILNRLPNSIIENYTDELIANFKEILDTCSIGDLKIFELLIPYCVENEDIYNLSRKAMLNTTIRPELLHDKFPDFFTETILLNYSPVVLKEKYILKLKRLLPCINTGFFITHPVSKKLVKTILKKGEPDDISRFFRALSISLKEGKGRINKDALKYCINDFTISELLPKYEFNLMEQLKTYKLVKDNEDLLCEFIKKQNVPVFFIKHFLKKDLIHHYLAHNKYCTDETLINFHKTNKEIKWLQVNTTLNISNHLQYATYLKDIGEIDVIEYNLELNIDKNVKLSNLRALEKLNINKNILYAAFLSKINELESGIHMEESYSDFQP